MFPIKFIFILVISFLSYQVSAQKAAIILEDFEGTSNFSPSIFTSQPPPDVSLKLISRKVCNHCVQEGSFSKEISWSSIDLTQYWGWGLKLGGLNASQAYALQFDIKGAKSGEYFEIKLKDKSNVEVALKSLGYVDVEAEFSNVVIPLNDFFSANQNLNLARLEALYFAGNQDTAGKEGKIYLDNIRIIFEAPKLKVVEGE